MHEFSLVRSLLHQVAALAEAHGGTVVREVHVEIGPLSGVEPVLLRMAFEQLISASPFPHATLQIDEVPLTAHCGVCKQEFTIADYHFRCPHCAATDVNVTGGDAFRLLDVTVDEVECSQEGQP